MHSEKRIHWSAIVNRHSSLRAATPVRSALLAGALLLLIATAFLPKVLEEMPDFEVYWRAGTRVLAAEPLYRAEDGHFQHKYWPVFGVLMTPLALLPIKAAKVVWFYGSVAALVALVAMSFRLLPHRKPPPLALVLVPTIAMLKFFAHELNLGQCNALMALSVMTGFGFLRSDRTVLAGVSFALSVAIKPYSVVFLPYLLLKRHLMALGVFLAFVLVSLVLPAAIYGIKGNAAQIDGWIRTIAESTLPNLLNQDNVSIWAMYGKWLGAGSLAFGLALGTIALVGIGFLVLLWKGSGVTGGEHLEMAMLLVLLPLLSPQGWDYTLLMAAPAVMVLVNEFQDLPVSVRVAGSTAVAVMALAVFDLMGRRAYAAFMSVSPITVCALVLLASMAYIRLHRLA